MSNLFTPEHPAELLLPLAESLLNAETLTLRQYRVWYLSHFTPQSLFAICAQMGREGFTGHRNRPVTLPTIKKALLQARRIIDLAHLKQLEETGGEILFANVVAHGHHTKLSTDRTARDAHRRVGLGIHIQQPAPCYSRLD